MALNKIEGDFSDYPDEIKDILPYIHGELCELRSNWEVYKRLFMTNKHMTEIIGSELGSAVGVFQNLLQESLFLVIACLTDKNSSTNKNLSLWTLKERCEEWNGDVADKIESDLKDLDEKLSRIRRFRNKQLAHFDLRTSLGTKSLPEVTLKDLIDTIQGLEEIMNEIEYVVKDSTILFDAIDAYDITHKLETAAYKVKHYNNLVKEGKIDRLEWQKYYEE